LCERKSARKFAPPAVFLAFHVPPFTAPRIIIAEQMQNAVNEITHDFRLPARAKLARLPDRLVHADENFAVKRASGAWHPAAGVGIVKCDDVRRTLMLEKCLIEPGYFRRGDQVNAEFRALNIQIIEQCRGDLFQQTQIDFPRPVAIENANIHSENLQETT